MDLKRKREDEIRDISFNAWDCVIDLSKKEDTQISLNETIRINNPKSHLVFSAQRLFEAPKKRIVPEDIDSGSSDEELPEAPPRIPKPITQLKPSEFYDQFIARTAEQCAEELRAPQKSQEWLDARKFCITASQFGSAMGESPYQTPEELLVEKTWFTFKGNAACDWGNQHENHAKEAFCDWFGKNVDSNYVFREENLIKFHEMPWMGVSPDGLIEYTNKEGQKVTDLVEFKCPAYLRNTSEHPYKKWTLNTPPQYYAQIQGIMGYLNSHYPPIQKAWLVIWQPHQSWITLHPFNKNYFDENLFPKVKEWYFMKLLPALTHKYNGLLDFGSVNPNAEIFIS